jgi:hypothetical protein
MLDLTNITNVLKSHITPGINESCHNCTAGFLNKFAQSRLKPAPAFVVKEWEMLVSICCVL